MACVLRAMTFYIEIGQPGELSKGVKVVSMTAMVVVLLQGREERPRIRVVDAAAGIYEADVRGVFDYPYICDASENMTMLKNSNPAAESALVEFGSAFNRLLFPRNKASDGCVLVDTRRCLTSAEDRAFYQYYTSVAMAAVRIQQDIHFGRYSLAELREKVSTTP